MRRGFWVVLMMLAAACGGEPDVSETEGGRLVLGASAVEETVRRSVAPGGRTLVLEGFNGTLHLRGTAAGQADLTFTKRARGQDDNAAREALAGIRLAEEGDSETYRYTVETERPEVAAMDVTGEVPRGTTLRIRSESGTILLSAIDGPITVENTRGPVRIAGAGADVEVQTRTGDIDVGLQALPAEAVLRLTTENGDVALTLPGTAAARIEADTEVGDVRVQGLDFGSRDFTPRGAGARFVGVLNQGNARVLLRTRNGDVVLREGRVTTLPEDAAPAALGAPAAAETLASPAPRLPIPMQDSLRRATPGGPDTSGLRPGTGTR